MTTRLPAPVWGMPSVAVPASAASRAASQSVETVMLRKPGPASSTFSMKSGFVSISFANTASAIFRGGWCSTLALASASLHWKSPNRGSVAGTARIFAKSFPGNTASKPPLNHSSIDIRLLVLHSLKISPVTRDA